MLTTSNKIGYVLEDHIKKLLESNYKSVTESEFASRFYRIYPFLNQSQSLKDNLEYWYIYDGITLCKHNHFSELEFRNRALERVKNREDYTNLSTFQLLDFLYLIDCLVWVDDRMVGIQIASMLPKGMFSKHNNNDNDDRSSNTITTNNSNNEFSKYSSVRSLAKKGIHSWLDTMIVIYSNLECLKTKCNTQSLLNSVKYIANTKPLLRNCHGYLDASSIYDTPLTKRHKPFLITVDEQGVNYTNNKANTDSSKLMKKVKT